MDGLIAWLRRLNRKEWFYVIAKALQNSTEFKLHKEFRESLKAAIGGVEVPDDAFAAMDYHFDWIQGALVLAGWEPAKGEKPKVFRNDSMGKQKIAGNQEDVDLLVAFEVDGVTHLVLLEAKGVGAWSNSQSASKRERLVAIFGDDEQRWRDLGLRLYWVFMSPKQSKGLKLDGWPRWALTGGQPRHIVMDLPAELWDLTRINPSDISPRTGKQLYLNWTVRQLRTGSVESLVPEGE